MQLFFTLLLFVSHYLCCSGAPALSSDYLKSDVLSVPSNCTIKSASNDNLAIHYTGTLSDGNKFDSSYDKLRPLRFQLGAGEVIKGWEKGLLGMCPDEKRRLTVPPSLAYGDRGAKQLGIPSGATLQYEITLVSIDRPHVGVITSGAKNDNTVNHTSY